MYVCCAGYLEVLTLSSPDHYVTELTLPLFYGGWYIMLIRQFERRSNTLMRVVLPA